MTCNQIVKSCIAFCLTAVLLIAVSGCEDLGAYEDTTEYYNSFGDIVLINATSKSKNEYSVEDYFYNEDAREDFLEGDDGAYNGVEYGDYVYMAIPLESDIEMDTLALYLCSKSTATVYINVFVTDKIPSQWKSIEDNEIKKDNTNEGTELPSDSETDKEEKNYDDPALETRVGEVAVHLKNEKWGSFVLDTFNVLGTTQKSIQIKDGQYILLQFRNNSGVRIFNEEKQIYVDPQTGLDLQKAEFTMTNLLIRALEISDSNETQGG